MTLPDALRGVHNAEFGHKALCVLIADTHLGRRT